ncbi:CHASE2 domain-containing protein [Massilia jejuensis]|uniref:CHASE2 domain-containing protein n=1 Tax=Massilia jejuensis TaxID=648894 RepID=A0ABW0PMC5_9BURK
MLETLDYIRALCAFTKGQPRDGQRRYQSRVHLGNQLLLINKNFYFGKIVCTLVSQITLIDNISYRMTYRFSFSVLRVALVDALRLSNEERRPPRYPLPTFVWAFVILVLVSFGMLYLGDKLNASGMVLTRFMGAGQAAVTAQIGYPGDARDQVAVVLYDEQFLRAYQSAWPISYQDHADWLLRLAGQPGARPKAIFLDITFGQEREDPTLLALKEAFCTLRDTLHVPVFVAALPDAVTGKLAVREGLGSCFTMVGADYTPDPLDGYAWTYPLTRHLETAGWKSGLSVAPAQPAYRSAAMAIAQDSARIELGEESVPMALVWGENAAGNAPIADRDRGCAPGRSLARNLTPGVFFQFAEPPPPLCPYHHTLSMEQVGALPDNQLAAALKDRYVMVGANIPGHNDFARSPVHGLVPGVHYHAMALDNLLSYGARYKLNQEWNIEGLTTLSWPGLLTVLAVLAVHWLWSWLLAKVTAGKRWQALASRQAGPRWLRTGTDEATLRGRTGLALLGALAWATRLTLQFVSAALLIALLQTVFRAGMLPVVELIGMTLFAEAVDYLARLRWYVLGKETLESEVTPDPEARPIPVTTTL